MGRGRKILTWREMLPGAYRYLGIENRGENDYGRPINVITLETKEGVKMYYAPSPLYWNLNRRSETSFIKKIREKKLFCQLKKRELNEYIMTEENDAVMAEVMNLLEVEPASLPVAAPGPDIPALREQLAILVSTGKCKEAIGVNLRKKQVRQLEDKEVMKHYKRYETYVGDKTTEALIESFLSFSTKALSMVVGLKDSEALRNELKNDYITTNELSALSGGLALRCGRMLAVANAFLITAKFQL